MKRSFFQVVGRGSLCIDSAGGKSVAYRPGDVFEESPLNKSVARGLRVKRLRELDAREVRALRMAAEVAAKRKAAAAAMPAPVVKAKKPADEPIIVLPDVLPPSE